MWAKPTALLAVTAAFLVLPATANASALRLGIQDDGRTTTTEQRNNWATQIGATWERTIANIGQAGVADRIRAAHAAGRQIIITIGGVGTSNPRPSFAAALAYIATLPQADAYTISNEPDLDGVDPCTYRKGWMKARRILGNRLLWGDTSPHHPLSFTLRASRCGPLPTHLRFALHPYQWSDPLAHGGWDGSLGNLSHAERFLKTRMGVTVEWWLDEFGYVADYFTDQRAAWMWPRAIRQAERHHARMLILYMADGATWDSRPGELAWAAIRSGASV